MKFVIALGYAGATKFIVPDPDPARCYRSYDTFAEVEASHFFFATVDDAVALARKACFDDGEFTYRVIWLTEAASARVTIQ